ncbi:MAG: SDR family NAD(P)-dependent oxidoreductase [Flavobacteriia bacterium]|nr:SDR family NAD(P)-dependent oxidoreductase [Flavobacteriia bacterium]
MILVTGATGLLGSNLCLELVLTNNNILATYHSEAKIDKVKKLFKWRFEEEWEHYFNKLNWEKLDVLDIYNVEKTIKKVDYVYHCAALVSFHKRDFSALMKVNAQGTSNIVNACLKFNVKKLLHVSSTSAVGKVLNHTVSYVAEKNKWENSKNVSGYGISKYTAEKEVWRSIEEGLNAVIINPSIIFGPGSWEESSLSIFRQIEKGLSFYTEGENAFVSVKDVVDAMIFLMENDFKSERYLCTGNNVSFKELFSLIAKKLNKKEPRWKASRWMIELAWKIAYLKVLFGEKPNITKETAHSSYEKTIYSSEKLKSIYGKEFLSLEETIDYTVTGRIV